MHRDSIGLVLRNISDAHYRLSAFVLQRFTITHCKQIRLQFKIPERIAPQMCSICNEITGFLRWSEAFS